MRSVLGVLILTGCASGPGQIEFRDIPGPTVYVGIPSEMTAHPRLPPLATTNPLQCPAEANDRRGLLDDAYRQLDAIRAIQGTQKETP